MRPVSWRAPPAQIAPTAAGRHRDVPGRDSTPTDAPASGAPVTATGIGQQYPGGQSCQPGSGIQISRQRVVISQTICPLPPAYCLVRNTPSRAARRQATCFGESPGTAAQRKNRHRRCCIGRLWKDDPGWFWQSGRLASAADTPDRPSPDADTTRRGTAPVAGGWPALPGLDGASRAVWPAAAALFRFGRGQ